MKRIYYDGLGNTINLYVGYLASQRQNQEVVSYRYDWLHNNSQVIRISLNPQGDFEINKTRYYRDKKTRFAYFWYNIDGKIMNARYSTKFEILMNAFLRKRTNGAMVVISFEENFENKSDNSLNVKIQFLKELFPILGTYFNCNQN